MKNVFARTVLALVLIPSLWMTSVGTAAAAWFDAPGETVGKMAECDPQEWAWDGEYGCINPLPVSVTCSGGFCRMRGWPPFGVCVENSFRETRTTAPWLAPIRYMQFVPDYPATNTALSGKCYYYEAGGPSSGKSGPHTWRWDY